MNSILPELPLRSRNTARSKCESTDDQPLLPVVLADHQFSLKNCLLQPCGFEVALDSDASLA